ncbi:SsrA-binding protein [Sutterella sp. KLE1602]|nr:SsrA-binding protein SmpB [Sutterella sp. KLE1602]KXT39417.1 SsrA-binding protein [Sutterella sp. KLE1602]
MIAPLEKPSAAVSEGLRSRVKSLTIQDCRAVCTKRTPTVRKQDDKNQKNAIQENKRNIMALIQNKRARHDYAIEEKFEAGIVLQGWEVKSVRASRAQINLAHIYVRDGELFLCNAHMTPADQACTHVTLESNRTRKLLMHRREIMKLIGKTERAGYTLVPLDLHFTRGRVKVTVALARGMREYEKRADQSKKDWKREQERIMKKDAHGRHVLE